MISRPATHDDLERVTDIMTSAFAEDPVWGGWGFPDRDRVRATDQRRAFWRYLLHSGLRFPWIRIAEGNGAATLWCPPGEDELTPAEADQLGPFMRGLVGDHCDVFMEGIELFEANLPEEPHFHLDLIGTHADRRGSGIGMDLLRENLGLVDETHMPAYLESTNPANLGRYGSVGFVVIGQFTLPGDGPTVDRMWREPR